MNPATILSVSQLTSRIKDSLERTFPQVWVAGEVSDVSRPHSGHVYFALKDAYAQIRGVIWRTTASRLPFDLQDGMQVICGGSIDVYAPRGAYQLIVAQMEPRGVGAQQLALRKLQAKLAAEGLFDPARKRRLPVFPQRIALVTSPTGAAVRDFLEVLRRRWPSIDVLVVPTRVQGDGAAYEIARAIRIVNRLLPAPHVLVVGRGGGSLDDLSAFNDEGVVRAICGSQVPVVSAVGHEIDVTLADLAADVRALTPSEAAERVVPSLEEVRTRLRKCQQRLSASLRARANQARVRLESLASRRSLRRPLDRIHDLARRLDELEGRARRALTRRLARDQERLTALAGRLESLSPLAVLARGYSVTLKENGEVIRDAEQVAAGERIVSRLGRGRVESLVVERELGAVE